MSILTTPNPTQHNLLLNFFKEYKKVITTVRSKNYHKRLVQRNNEPDTMVREIEWFEELEKGCLVYVKGHKEPMRGLMYWDDFQAGFIWKKGLVLFIRFLNGQEGFVKKSLLKKLILFWSAKEQYPFFLTFIHHALYDNIYENVNKLSQPIRELYRAFPKELEKERDIICFFLESDHAYRYRFQDIVMEINKEAFKKNPLKESLRLLEIMKEREPTKGLTMWHKWNAIQKLLPFAYYYIKIFKPKLYKMIIKMVESLNINEIEPTKEDRYWMNGAESYNFRSIKYNTRKILQ